MIWFPLPVIRERARVRGNLAAIHYDIPPESFPLTPTLSRITGRGSPAMNPN